jgi:type IV secretion system protein VirB10
VSAPATRNDAPNDGLPLVGEDRGNRGLWLGLGGIAIGGLLLFTALEANRSSSSEPQIAPAQDYATASVPRPELAIPLEPAPSPFALPPPQSPALQVPFSPRLAPVRLTPIRPDASVNASPPVELPPPNRYAPLPLPDTPDPGRSAPAIVYDAVQNVANEAAAAVGSAVQATKAFAVGGGDRTYLVPQGTLIFAILETALDSTQAGQTRAIISSPVYNALGTEILIPKGSRIFGEYKADLDSGQSRAQVIWTRLIRPDGVTIALNSPASDTLGRAGIKGRVNTHFGERLLGALLQSTIDFGVAVGSRAVTSNNGVFVSLPGAVQSSSSQIVQPAPKPTLTVRHGTRVAVFVARDLDFSGVD